MEDIIHVRPYDKRENTAFSGLITPTKYAEPVDAETVTIPVPKVLDIEEILSENNQKMNQEEGDDMDLEEDLEAKFVVPVKDIVMENLKQQISLVVMPHFRQLSEGQVEKIFNGIFRNPYVWGRLETDTVTVFVQVGSLADLKAVVENQDVFEGVCGKLVVNLHGVELAEVKATDFDRSKVKAAINGISRAQKAKKDKSLGGENAGSIYESYKIDALELIDVPNSMKPTIIKELIQFRSGMLIKEQEKRARELVEERNKAKQRLKALFQENNVPDKDAEMDTGEVEPEEVMPELNDEEYEAELQRLEKERSEKAYKQKVRDLELMTATRTKLKRKLEALEQYENNLIENKFKYIDDLKDYHFESYSEYWTKRSKIKQREEEMDEADRREEGEQTDEMQTERNEENKAEKVGTNIDGKGGQNGVEENKEGKTQKNKEKEQNEMEEVEEKEPQKHSPVTDTTLPIVTHLSASQLSSLKAHISTLVVKFIGIEENDLVEFIYDGLVSQTLTMEELRETFDNDAENLVDGIKEFLSSCV